MNDFSTCTLEELFEMRQACWSVMSDDDRKSWQVAKDNLEAAALKEQKLIMKEQVKNNYA